MPVDRTTPHPALRVPFLAMRTFDTNQQIFGEVLRRLQNDIDAAALLNGVASSSSFSICDAERPDTVVIVRNDAWLGLCLNGTSLKHVTAESFYQAILEAIHLDADAAGNMQLM